MTLGQALDRLALPARYRAVMGFDGFVDRIGRLKAHAHGDRIDSMTKLGELLIAHNELSLSLQLDGSVERLGGNMPNTADALSQMGVAVSCIGAFGREGIHRAFAPLMAKCDLYTYGDPGISLAMEFRQGKVFLGDACGLDALDFEAVARSVGLQRMVKLMAGADLIGLFNWGELAGTQKIWEGLLREVMPRLAGKRRIILADPSDLSDRSDADIRLMAHTLGSFCGAHSHVILSANEGEFGRLTGALGVAGQGREEGVRAIAGRGFCDWFVLHSARDAVASDGAQVAVLPTRHMDAPLRQTGGGDNFNAGLALGLLHGLSMAGCLMAANGASSHFVRTGAPATLDQLMEEMAKSRAVWA